MITIATFTTPEDAHLFRACLGSQGIEGYVFDEYFVQLFWYYSNAIGGVRVAVDDADAAAAGEAYQNYMGALRSGPYPVQPLRAWQVVLIIFLMGGGPLIFSLVYWGLNALRAH